MSLPPRYWAVGVFTLLYLVFALVREAQRSRRLKDLKPRPDDVPLALWRLYREYLAGRLNVPLLEALRLCAPKGLDIGLINTAVCLEVAAGRYSQALLWRGLWSVAKPSEYELLVRINEAEALANLGRFEESLAWIDREGSQSLTIAGIAAHRAWCLAALGRPDEGRAALSKGKPRSLGREYRSEWHFSEAAIAVASAQWDEAAGALERAELFARRASTKRNLSFMNGMRLASQGRHQEALPHFERGASSIYVGQGGDALLTWGDSLMALGRHDEAQRVWALCVDRDPQAPSATAAQLRLENNLMIRSG